MKKRWWFLAVTGAGLIMTSCAPARDAAAISSRDFGVQDGTPVQLYTLKNAHGIEAAITNHGATLVSLKVPGKTSPPADVVLGFDALGGYTQTPPPPYFGATIGRYANRIAKGSFVLDGATFAIEKNEGQNSLHGGSRGFDKVVWTARHVAQNDGQAVSFSYLSKDGEAGYPGNLSVGVTYVLTSANELRITYSATTDKKTVLNLTNHSYFNLAGHDSGDILGHLVMINADQFTPVDAALIPTGELRKVDGTPFDFRQPRAVGERIGLDDEQLKLGHGYDHNWILNRSGDGLQFAASVSDPKSGRTMDVLTTEPGVQFYTGNFLDGSFHGKGGAPYRFRQGLTMETQHFPDSPNHPAFPSVVLEPGRNFQSTTIFRFRLPFSGS